MSFERILQCATLISVMAAIAGLIFSIRAHKRQLSASFLLEYTRRVDDLLRSLPPNVWGAHVFANEPIPPPSTELQVSVLRCMTLVAQLHYFSREGFFPQALWDQHESTYAQILRSPLFVREWKLLAPIFAGDPAYCRFVERAQQQAG